MLYKVSNIGSLGSLNRHPMFAEQIKDFRNRVKAIASVSPDYKGADRLYKQLCGIDPSLALLSAPELTGWKNSATGVSVLYDLFGQDYVQKTAVKQPVGLDWNSADGDYLANGKYTVNITPVAISNKIYADLDIKMYGTSSAESCLQLLFDNKYTYKYINIYLGNTSVIKLFDTNAIGIVNIPFFVPNNRYQVRLIFYTDRFEILDLKTNSVVYNKIYETEAVEFGNLCSINIQAYINKNNATTRVYNYFTEIIGSSDEKIIKFDPHNITPNWGILPDKNIVLVDHPQLYFDGVDDVLTGSYPEGDYTEYTPKSAITGVEKITASPAICIGFGSLHDVDTQSQVLAILNNWFGVEFKATPLSARVNSFKKRVDAQSAVNPDYGKLELLYTGLSGIEKEITSIVSPELTGYQNGETGVTSLFDLMNNDYTQPTAVKQPVGVKAIPVEPVDLNNYICNMDCRIDNGKLIINNMESAHNLIWAYGGVAIPTIMGGSMYISFTCDCNLDGVGLAVGSGLSSSTIQNKNTIILKNGINLISIPYAQQELTFNNSFIGFWLYKKSGSGVSVNDTPGIEITISNVSYSWKPTAGQSDPHNRVLVDQLWYKNHSSFSNELTNTLPAGDQFTSYYPLSNALEPLNEISQNPSAKIVYSGSHPSSLQTNIKGYLGTFFNYPFQSVWQHKIVIEFLNRIQGEATLKPDFEKLNTLYNTLYGIDPNISNITDPQLTGLYATGNAVSKVYSLNGNDYTQDTAVKQPLYLDWNSADGDYFVGMNAYKKSGALILDYGKDIIFDFEINPFSTISSVQRICSIDRLLPDGKSESDTFIYISSGARGFYIRTYLDDGTQENKTLYNVLNMGEKAKLRVIKKTSTYECYRLNDKNYVLLGTINYTPSSQNITNYSTRYIGSSGNIINAIKYYSVSVSDGIHATLFNKETLDDYTIVSPAKFVTHPQLYFDGVDDVLTGSYPEGDYTEYTPKSAITGVEKIIASPAICIGFGSLHDVETQSQVLAILNNWFGVEFKATPLSARVNSFKKRVDAQSAVNPDYGKLELLYTGLSGIEKEITSIVSPELTGYQNGETGVTSLFDMMNNDYTQPTAVKQPVGVKAILVEPVDLNSYICYEDCSISGQILTIKNSYSSNANLWAYGAAKIPKVMGGTMYISFTCNCNVGGAVLHIGTGNDSGNTPNRILVSLNNGTNLISIPYLEKEITFENTRIGFWLYKQSVSPTFHKNDTPGLEITISNVFYSWKPSKGYSDPHNRALIDQLWFVKANNVSNCLENTLPVGDHFTSYYPSSNALEPLNEISQNPSAKIVYSGAHASSLQTNIKGYLGTFFNYPFQSVWQHKIVFDFITRVQSEASQKPCFERLSSLYNILYNIDNNIANITDPQLTGLYATNNAVSKVYSLNGNDYTQDTAVKQPLYLDWNSAEGNYLANNRYTMNIPSVAITDKFSFDLDIYIEGASAFSHTASFIFKNQYTAKNIVIYIQNRTTVRVFDTSFLIETPLFVPNNRYQVRFIFYTDHFEILDLKTNTIVATQNYGTSVLFGSIFQMQVNSFINNANRVFNYGVTCYDSSDAKIATFDPNHITSEWIPLDNTVLVVDHPQLYFDNTDDALECIVPDTLFTGYAAVGAKGDSCLVKGDPVVRIQFNSQHSAPQRELVKTALKSFYGYDFEVMGEQIELAPMQNWGYETTGTGISELLEGNTIHLKMGVISDLTAVIFKNINDLHITDTYAFRYAIKMQVKGIGRFISVALYPMLSYNVNYADFTTEIWTASSKENIPNPLQIRRSGYDKVDAYFKNIQIQKL